MTVIILPKPLDEMAVADISDQTYTGSALTLAETVKDGEKVLEKGEDYRVVYTDNMDAGSAGVAVTFQGNYTGSVLKAFAIVKQSTPSGGGNGNPSWPVKDVTGTGAPRYHYHCSQAGAAGEKRQHHSQTGQGI